MARKKPTARGRRSDSGARKHPSHRLLDQESAAERGERIATGKMIHRGGKSAGHVPGATADTQALAPAPRHVPIAPASEPHLEVEPLPGPTEASKKDVK